MSRSYHIDPNIKKAETLPSSFYRDKHLFEEMKDNIFAKSWQWVGDENLVPSMNSVYPFVLLDDFLTEPLFLSRNKNNQIQCFSNVCTHRGNLILQNPDQTNEYLCRYHGRRFNHDGKFKTMPEFQDAENFPRPCDDLHKVQLEKIGPFIFIALDPSFQFSELSNIFSERIAFLPLHKFKYEASLSKDYLVNCHWAIYCDNYLEGFHIPFVHEDLNKVLDYGKYATEIYTHLNLQIGYANDDEESVFDLPPDHIDFGKNVAAYYFWVFPNMMFNFYPWGLSINIIKPISINKTKVSFISYVYDKSKVVKGAGAILDKVEMEDEFVVEGVTKGMQSRFYHAGRFSPSKEKGVHHFHSLLAKYL